MGFPFATRGSFLKPTPCSPFLLLTQPRSLVVFISSQTPAFKILWTTCWFGHQDQTLDLVLSLPLYLSLCLSFSLSHFPSLLLYFWFNPQRVTSSLVEVKNLECRSTDHHLETFLLWDAVILRHIWVGKGSDVLEAWWYFQDTGVILGNGKSHIRRFWMPDWEFETLVNSHRVFSKKVICSKWCSSQKIIRWSMGYLKRVEKKDRN